MMTKTTYSEHTYYTPKSAAPVLLDLGACEGDFTRHFIATYPDATVVMVEANRSLYPKLARVLSPRVSSIWAAVSGRKGSLTFTEDLSSIHCGSWVFDTAEHRSSYDVPSITLDDLVQSVGQVDLVKMDVEGAEWEIIETVSPAALDRIAQMTIEFHDFLDPSLTPRTERCIRLLKDNGFNADYEGTTYMHGSKYYNTTFYKK